MPGRPVLSIAAALAVLELVLAPRYGWHRDELYFLEAGEHLEWGFIDMPPFVPFVARIANAIAPGNLVVLRTLPAISVGAVVVVGSLLAREVGGRREAQVATAAVLASGGFVLGAGHLLSTAVFDLLAWMILVWLVARVLRTGDPRWWIAFGAVAGVSMLNKNLLVLLGIALLAGLIVERRWDLLLSPWLVVGGVLAVALASTQLLWQADHGWPQADMARVLSKRVGPENRVTLVPAQILFAGPAFVTVLWGGARALARMPELRPYRVLLWAWPAGLAAAFIAGGRQYYALPLTLAILVVGVAARTTWRTVLWLALANLLISLPLALPVLPASSAKVTAAVNETSAETIGWPGLVDQVAGVVRDLPADEQPSVVLLAGSYGEAGAIDRFGGERRLPKAFSPHNSYADFRRPTDDDATVVAVRFSAAYLSRWFDDCEEVATVENAHRVDNEVRGAPIHVCRGLRGSWPDVWEEMRFLA